MRLLGLFVLSSFCGFPQPVTFGIKAGAPLDGLLDATQFPPGNQGATSTTNPYIIGPTVELRLPRNLSLEVDALFRHYRYQWYVYLIGSGAHTIAIGNAWEFPILVKYKLPGRFLKPYIDGGAAFDRVEGLSAIINSYTATESGSTTMTTQTSSPSELEHRTSAGVVIGGGIDIHMLFLHVSPEIRYTRWSLQHFGADFVNSSQNQVEFLLGVTF
jgi:hypothetical protein